MNTSYSVCAARLLRSIVLKVVPEYAENIDEVIIEGGFHQREDVYLNADAASLKHSKTTTIDSGANGLYTTCQ